MRVHRASTPGRKTGSTGYNCAVPLGPQRKTLPCVDVVK